MSYYYITQSGHYGHEEHDEIAHFNRDALTADEWQTFQELPDGLRYRYITNLRIAKTLSGHSGDDARRVVAELEGR